MTTHSMAPARCSPKFRQLSGPLVTVANRLVTRRRLAISVGAETWNIQLLGVLSASHAIEQERFHWHIACGEHLYSVGMSPATADALAAACGCVCPMSSLPAAIGLAVGKTVLAELSRHLQECGVPVLGLERLELGALPEADRVSITWEAKQTASMATHRGTLSTTPAGLAYLSELLASCASATADHNEWPNLPLPTTMELGRTVLPRHALLSLREGDVILTDEAWTGADKSALLLRLSERLLVRAEIDKHRNIIAKSGVLNMTQEQTLTDPTHDEIGSDMDLPDSLDSLPVTLSFSLGERTIEYRQLSELASGYVFDLALPVSQAVQIRANGTRIGEGELVEIDGRIGVAISRLATKAMA